MGKYFVTAARLKFDRKNAQHEKCANRKNTQLESTKQPEHITAERAESLSQTELLNSIVATGTISSVCVYGSRAEPV